MTGAFDGSSTVKQALLAAFDAFDDRPDAVPGLAAVLKKTATGASAAVGYPEALTRFLDRLVGTLAEGRSTEHRVMACGLARRCLAEVAPGADLSAVPVRILETMLWEVDTRAGLRTAAPALRAILLGVIDLQKRRADGIDVVKGDWAAIRERAVASTDGFDDPMLAEAGLAVESAAWDLATSSGVLIDVLKPYSALIARDAVRAEGWTVDHGRRSETMLRGIYDETQGQRDAGEDVSIPALFRARDPELARRYTAYLDTRDSSGRASCRALLDHILTLLADAPVTVPETVGA